MVFSTTLALRTYLAIKHIPRDPYSVTQLFLGQDVSDVMLNSSNADPVFRSDFSIVETASDGLRRAPLGDPVEDPGTMGTLDTECTARDETPGPCPPDSTGPVINLAGADAIHPGYGFLSENAQFAEIVELHNIIWVGPKPEHISIMGDKIEAKRTAAKLGLPLVPGSDGPLETIAEARKLARKVGYPVLIKAASGGGGRGMKVVTSEAQLESLMSQAASEARSAFGDADLGSLFEPFFRVDRSRSKRTGGYGLGLSAGEVILSGSLVSATKPPW